MKKIPCLFIRDFTDKRRPKITEQITPGCEWVLAGEGVATRKFDGSACLVKDGVLFKRYDAKNGKIPPVGFIPSQESSDPVTGHWPGWLKAAANKPEDQYLYATWACRIELLLDGTYEFVGPKVNSNPEGFTTHQFIRHGSEVIYPANVDCTLDSFDGIKHFLEIAPMEGIVFWRDPDNQDCDKVKIRRDDFGFDWPVKK